MKVQERISRTSPNLKNISRNTKMHLQQPKSPWWDSNSQLPASKNKHANHSAKRSIPCRSCQRWNLYNTGRSPLGSNSMKYIFYILLFLDLLLTHRRQKLKIKRESILNDILAIRLSCDSKYQKQSHT